MKKNGFWLFGLLSFTAVLLIFGHTGDSAPSGKYHPQNHGRDHTSTVTILNPALFHRLNTVLEPVLIGNSDKLTF